MLRNRLRHAGAADMVIEADDAIGPAHDDVQVVRNEKHAKPGFIAQAADEVVEVGFAAVVDALHGLVENEEVRRPQQGARKDDALQLTAGQLAELLPADGRCIDVGQYLSDAGLAVAAPEHEEAFYRHRDHSVAAEALRHVSDLQIAAAVDSTAIRFLEAEQDTDERRLACAVGADEGNDLALADVDVDVDEESIDRASLRPSRWAQPCKCP
jgi:hypothetical protein